MTFAERLKEERKKAGLSQKEFAEKLGLNARTYASYERGERDISTSLLLNICTTLNISSDELLGNKLPTQPPYPRNATPATQIERSPVLFWGKVSAGIGAYAEGRAIRTMPANDDDMLEGYEYAWLEVEGDSMSPDLQDGDYVLVRVQDTAENGDLIVALIDNGCEHDGVVKRLEIEPGSHLALISINPAYPPRIFVGEQMNAVHIFGIVVTSQRRWH